MSNVVERVIAFLIFILFLPVFLIIGLFIILESKGNPIFVQKRIGKGGKRYNMYKFRTMVVHKEKGFVCTYQSDPRITKVGSFLRKTRLDESLQLINIIKGDMSFVGVRPDVENHYQYYTKKQKDDYEKYRPGIYGLATYVYKNENTYLEKASDKKQYYIDVLLKEKCKLNKIYNDHKNIKLDFQIILASFNILKCIKIGEKEYNIL